MNLAKGLELGGGILLADQHGAEFLGLRVHQVIEDGVAVSLATIVMWMEVMRGFWSHWSGRALDRYISTASFIAAGIISGSVIWTVHGQSPVGNGISL